MELLCPICGGAKRVRVGFYEMPPPLTSLTTEKCRRCGGEGTLSTYDPASEAALPARDTERPDALEAKVAAANRYSPTKNHHGRTERNAFWKGWDEHREFVRDPEQKHET
jgi:hypothetical protein